MLGRQTKNKLYVKVTDEKGKVMYEGEEQRDVPPYAFNKNRFFEVKAIDLAKVVGIIWLAFNFYYSTKTEIMDLHKQDAAFKLAIIEQKKINALLTEYMQNHDSYLSATTGYRFQAGVPIELSSQTARNYYNNKVAPDITTK